MVYNGNEKRQLTLEEAQERYQSYLSNQSSLTDFTSVYFSRSALLDILAQNNCVGIRLVVSHDAAVSATGKTVSAVGVDSDGNELVGDDRIYLSRDRCPPDCHSGTGQTIT